jgi:hypothetical protein
MGKMRKIRKFRELIEFKKMKKPEIIRILIKIPEIIGI